MKRLIGVLLAVAVICLSGATFSNGAPMSDSEFEKVMKDNEEVLRNAKESIHNAEVDICKSARHSHNEFVDAHDMLKSKDLRQMLYSGISIYAYERLSELCHLANEEIDVSFKQALQYPELSDDAQKAYLEKIWNNAERCWASEKVADILKKCK